VMGKPIAELKRCATARLGARLKVAARKHGVVPILAAAMFVASGSLPARAQTPDPPLERLTFQQAVGRAVVSHPRVEQAAAGILRAEAALDGARAAVRPSIDARVSTTAIDPVPAFGGTTINPRTQLLAGLGVSASLLDPVSWARRTQAGDDVAVARQSAWDVRQQVAVAAAQAYLQIVTARRVLELNERARENARAHSEFANRRFQGGIGSRLDALRARQELSSIEMRVEEARLDIRRSQEALGVLVAAEGPVDAADVPAFELPPAGTAEGIDGRPDIQLAVSRRLAAERVVGDSWKDYLPSVTALFDPQVLAPSGLFVPARSWRASVVFAVPVLDGGGRRALARARRSQLDTVRAEAAGVERDARSQVRTARAAVESTERALASARAAAGQAEEVLDITDIAFRAGATTNIEVVDAQRRARDAETAAAIAEDNVRRARLELLIALGRFPQ
jgi:outer membrane protein